MKVRYSLRELLLAVTIIGVAIGVLIEHNRQAGTIEYLRQELTAQYQDCRSLFGHLHSQLAASSIGAWRNPNDTRDAHSILEDAARYVQNRELEQMRHLEKVLAQ